MICQSSGCDICECRVLLSGKVRIGEARHVYSWRNPDGGNPDENTCYVSSGNVCHVASGGGVPTLATPEVACDTNEYPNLRDMNHITTNPNLLMIQTQFFGKIRFT